MTDMKMTHPTAATVERVEAGAETGQATTSTTNDTTPTPTGPHPVQQGHTHPNKATFPNSLGQAYLNHHTYYQTLSLLELQY